MQITIEQLDSITPYARNPRKNAGAVAKVKSSLKEYGWQQPIVVDEERVILAGHTRYQAALELGWTEAPVHIARGLTKAQANAYRIADNRTAQEAEWAMDLLALEIEDLKLDGFDLDLTGFEADEIAGMLDDADAGAGTDGDTEPEVDRADELREQWGVETGQLWQLGDHRLLCGDSTCAEDVARLMAGERADLCFTSPPYGQQRDYRDGAKDKVSDWDALMRGVFGNLPMSDAGQVLVNLGLIHRDNEWIPYWDGWIEWMRQQGWRRFGWYVWDQGPGLPGDWSGRLAPSHEFVFHFNQSSLKPNKTKESKRAGAINYGTGLRAKDGTVGGYAAAGKEVQPYKIPDSVIRVMRHKARGIECEHAAVFPVELPAEFIAAWPGLVYEPFSGSGTTIIACENLKRKCRAIEISPAYVAVALERWATHTGQEPVLIDGP